jgi:hypothetical protein
MKENSMRPWVLIPEADRRSTVARKIPLFSVEPVSISSTPYCNFRYSNQKIITLVLVFLGVIYN